ncbi:FlaG protein [compost metagenome]
MDMNVKLNLSYPAVAPQGNPGQPQNDAVPVKRVEPAEKPQRPELEKAVKDIQEFVQSTQRQLGFEIDDTTGTLVVKVIATESGEVIRQLPSEAALKLAQSLADVNSLLFDDHV